MMENDIEHTYKLAMCAWFIIQQEKLHLNLNKVLRYVLVHDLVETYAGDTNTFIASELATKKERESESLQRLLLEYPFLGKIIKKYEQKNDPESKFVYALDKLEVNLETLLDNGRSWKDLLKISLNDLVESKKGKIELDPTVHKYWLYFLKIITPKKKELFHYE